MAERSAKILHIFLRSPVKMLGSYKLNIYVYIYRIMFRQSIPALHLLSTRRTQAGSHMTELNPHKMDQNRTN